MSAAEPAEEKKVNPVVKYFSDFKVLKETRREYWGLQAVNMFDSLAYFAMFNIAVVTLSADFGFNDVQAGLIYTLFSSLTTIFLFVSGVITDWLGIKKALYTAIIGLTILRASVVVAAYMGDPVSVERDTPVAVLHDGEGIPVAPGADLVITAHDGERFEVDLGEPKTVGDVIDAINKATGGKVVADLAPGHKALQLEDHTEGDGKLVIEPTAGNPKAAKLLGLANEGATSNPLIGNRIITALNGRKVAELNQGRGLGGASTMTITDRAGHSVTVTGLDQETTVRGLMDRIEEAAKQAGVQIIVGYNNAGTGLRISDTTGLRTGSIKVSGDAAEALLIAGEESAPSISGGNLLANHLRNWLVVGALALMAPFMSMLQTVFQAGNRRFTTKRSRGAGFNLWYLFMNVGAMGGGFVIDIIYLDLGLPHFHVFTLGALTGFLSLLVISFTIKNTEQLRSPEELEEEAKAAAEKAARGEVEEEPEKRTPWTIVKEVVREPVFWRFTVLITLLLGVRAVFLYLGLLFPKFWYRVIGPDARVGALQAFNPILVIIGLILVIPILNKFNVYKMLVFGAMITSISMFIIAIPPMGGVDVATWTYGTTIAFLLVLTIGELIWSPRLSEYTAAIAPEGQEGTYLGLSMVPYFLAKLVVSGLSGAMLNRWCPEPPEDDPLALQKAIANHQLAFVDTPYMMFTILGAVAIVGTVLAIIGKPWFTKGAKL